MPHMNINKLRELIRSTNGRIFRVSFHKRTDGTLRHMRARLGVTKHLHGGSLAYNPKDHGLMTCFDMEKKDYRSIPLDSVFQFQCGQQKWKAV